TRIAEDRRAVERLRNETMGVAFREPALPEGLHAVGPVEMPDRIGVEPLGVSLEVAEVDQIDALAPRVEDRVAGLRAEVVRRERTRAGREGERLPRGIGDADQVVRHARRVEEVVE